MIIITNKLHARGVSIRDRSIFAGHYYSAVRGRIPVYTVCRCVVIIIIPETEHNVITTFKWIYSRLLYSCTSDPGNENQYSTEQVSYLCDRVEIRVFRLRRIITCDHYFYYSSVTVYLRALKKNVRIRFLLHFPGRISKSFDRLISCVYSTATRDVQGCMHIF
jgi:hypothetical protein